MDKVTVELEKDTAIEFADWIGFYLFQQIRDDPTIDNVEWLVDKIKIADALYKAAGGKGLL